MTIKEAEKLTGLTIKSIRYYEEKGLIDIGRNIENDYRNYTEEDIERLKLIKVLRYINFSIEDIAQIFETNDLANSLKEKSKQLEAESNNYLEKQSICNSLLKDSNKKEFTKVINDYSDTIDFLESDELKYFKSSFMESICPNSSALIIQSLSLMAPIIWLFINIHNKIWDALIFNSIAAMVCTALLVADWIFYFDYKKKHKETIKKKNKNSILTIPLFIIFSIIVIALFVLLASGSGQLLAPDDYLFYEPSLMAIKIMMFAVSVLFIIILSLILQKLKINATEDMDMYVWLWQKCKYVVIVLFIIIFYSFITSFTFVTNDKIIYRDYLHPFGISYKYSDVTKIETGFGNKSFSFIDYNQKGNFYYRIYIGDKKITFFTPSINSKIKRYENDTYLELEEFDKELMKYDIKKITDDKYANVCHVDLDKIYCDRFIRIINNK